MTVYRDAGHAIARAMSIETNDGTAKAAWQMRYKSGYEDAAPAGSGLTAQERLTQDAMTRALFHRSLPPAPWHALVAKYSINDQEVKESVWWMVSRAVTPAHSLFRLKCITAWAIPRRLPKKFYEVHSWDVDGTPEGTLRRWKHETKKWLDAQVSAGFKLAELTLKENHLLIDEAA